MLFSRIIGTDPPTGMPEEKGLKLRASSKLSLYRDGRTYNP